MFEYLDIIKSRVGEAHHKLRRSLMHKDDGRMKFAAIQAKSAYADSILNPRRRVLLLSPVNPSNNKQQTTNNK